MCLNAIERKLSSKLLNFQKYGVAFAISNGGRCMIADDMGLGKTRLSFAFNIMQRLFFYTSGAHQRGTFMLALCRTRAQQHGNFIALR